MLTVGLLLIHNFLANINTQKVTDMGGIFARCLNLEKLPDLSKWVTDNVTEMSYMFYKCKSLKSLPDISNWNTSKVISMYYMFGKCISLNNLPDLSNWKINKKMNCVFQGCKDSLNIPINLKF